MIDAAVMTLILANCLANLLAARWNPSFVMLRTAISVYGYIVRPTIILLFIYIVWDSPKRRLFWILIALNAAVFLTAFFRPWTFFITEDGIWHRGPLGYSAHWVSFILLAGGEPMLRWDVIESAGKMKNIMFPVFTNGTFMTDKHLELLEKCRNIVPVISIEGERDETDARRGAGVYDTVMEKMDKLHEKGIIYGVSVTVTKENLEKVYSERFLESLRSRGCKAVFYIEFTPVSDEGEHLAPDDDDREYMAARVDDLRMNKQDMIYISFPGDEKSSGGCLAAGRGFFHINSHGGAEPCPFSPYSDINVKDTSLREALRSKLFTALRSSDILADDHIGGCVLNEKREQVEALLGV